MSKYQSDSQKVSRREILVGAGVAALGMSTVRGEQQVEKTELEISNETLVTQFCRDWSNRDAEALLPYLWEDLTYQIAPGQPLITSSEQFVKMMGPFMKNLESIRWDILRQHVIGPVVLNERIDHFNAPEGGTSMRFQVAGHFLIEEGRIKVWKDWPIPGIKQIVGGQS
jgi:limonene-1,2-epoxide hydrolase